jgi:hypothetical protein
MAKQKQVPFYEIDGDYNEEEDLALFNCPYSGINTLSEEWTEDVYPDELVYFIMGLADETEYVRSDYEKELEEFNEAKELDNPSFDSYYYFYEYLVTKLPKDKNFYILKVNHPDDIMGDWNVCIYEGEYKEE